MVTNVTITSTHSAAPASQIESVYCILNPGYDTVVVIDEGGELLL